MRKSHKVVRSAALSFTVAVPFAPSWSRSCVTPNTLSEVSWTPAGPTLPTGCSMYLAGVVAVSTVQVWHIVGSMTEVVQRYQGHRDEIVTLAWSPDGRMIASASEDHTVQVWDVRRGTRLLTHSCQSNGVRALAWSPDGRFLALGGDDNLIQVLDITGGVHRLIYRGHTQGRYGIDALAWSPDGACIASSGDDGTVQIWDASSGVLLVTYRGHLSNWVLALAWSPDGRHIVSVGNDAQIWDAQNGEHRLTYRGHDTTTGWIDSVVWSWDGGLIASTSTEHCLHIWDASTGVDVQTCDHTVHDGEVEGVRVHTLVWSPEHSGAAGCVAFACRESSAGLCHVA